MAQVISLRSLSLDVDDEGHRTYKVEYLVQVDYLTEGPASVLTAAGMPSYGEFYTFQGESDPWAYCRADAKVTAHGVKPGSPVEFYSVEKTFSSKPQKKCSEQNVENPLLQPQKVSGTFHKSSVEATKDRYGNSIMNSAWERIHGKVVEFDAFNPEVTIEQNVPDLELPLLARVNNTLNDAELWGYPRRFWRCTVSGWEQKYYGLCSAYYTRKLTFAGMARKDPRTGALTSGWDKDLLDEGTKALNGQWNTTTHNWDLVNIAGSAPSPYNPAHFIRVTDKKANPVKVILDGAGKPINKKIMGAITDISLDSPIVVTASEAHGLSSGDVVGVFGFEGDNHAARGVFLIEVTSSTKFALLTVPPNSLDPEATVDTVPIGQNPYVSGGFWVNVGDTGPGRVRVEYYDESNLLALGIPTDLNFVY